MPHRIARSKVEKQLERYNALHDRDDQINMTYREDSDFFLVYRLYDMDGSEMSRECESGVMYDILLTLNRITSSHIDTLTNQYVAHCLAHSPGV